jgi:TRAP-type C4-dicarboxylate transport system permease small subunit
MRGHELSAKGNAVIHASLNRILMPIIKFAEYAVVLLGLAMVVSVFVQVVLRYASDRSFYGSEELTRFMLSWFVFLSAAVGLDRGVHFEVDTFIRRLPPTAARAVALLAQLIVLAVLLVFFVKGIDMTLRNWRQASSALEIPMSFGNASIPAASLIMIGIVVREMLRPSPRNLRSEA